MRAGRLDQRVTIQSATVSVDSVGEPVHSWATFAEVWAEVLPMTGREYLRAQSLNVAETIRITVRYLAGVNETMRVLHGSRTYHIRSVIDVESRQKTLELMCEAIND